MRKDAMDKLSKTLLVVIVMVALTLSGCAAEPKQKAPWTRPADGMVMVSVPAGKFTMGMTAKDAFAICSKSENDCNLSDFKDEEPAHTVYLADFWIDKTDVTNAMYEKCVIAGACQKPTNSASASQTFIYYYGNPLFDNYPVIFMIWNDAQAYCKWAGVRLPTEAEWEKAARGTDKRTYPWGNQPPTCSLTNFGSIMISGGSVGCVGDTTEVDSYPSGASPYGALDMAGNVMNWVSDWYSPTYYASSPSSNPTGPASGQDHDRRGGTFDEAGGYIFSADRDMESSLIATGFRCATSTP